MTDCYTPGMVYLGLCESASSKSLFTFEDVIVEVMKANFVTDNDCSKDAGGCLSTIENMVYAGYRGAAVAEIMFLDYDLTFKTLGTALYDYTEFNTPDKIVEFINQAPYNASMEEMVETFTGINGFFSEIAPAITKVYPGELAILRMMRVKGGYTAIQFGYMFSYAQSPWVMYQGLREIGFSSSESSAARKFHNPHKLKDFDTFSGPVGLGFKFLFVGIQNF